MSNAIIYFAVFMDTHPVGLNVDLCYRCLWRVWRAFLLLLIYVVFFSVFVHTCVLHLGNTVHMCSSKVQIRAATNVYFHYPLIWRLSSGLDKDMDSKPPQGLWKATDFRAS